MWKAHIYAESWSGAQLLARNWLEPSNSARVTKASLPQDHMLMSAQQNISLIEDQTRELSASIASNHFKMQAEHAQTDARLLEINNLVSRLHQEHEDMLHKYQKRQTGQN